MDLTQSFSTLQLSDAWTSIPGIPREPAWVKEKLNWELGGRGTCNRAPALSLAEFASVIKAPPLFFFLLSAGRAGLRR